MVDWLDCLKEFEGGGGVGCAGYQVKSSEEPSECSDLLRGDRQCLEGTHPYAFLSRMGRKAMVPESASETKGQAFIFTWVLPTLLGRLTSMPWPRQRIGFIIPKIRTGRNGRPNCRISTLTMNANGLGGHVDASPEHYVFRFGSHRLYRSKRESMNPEFDDGWIWRALIAYILKPSHRG